MQPDLWTFERQAFKAGFARVAGLDEAGRGPLAGPVVAAAVILQQNFPAVGLDDSKKLTPKKRETLYAWIYENAVAVGIGIVDPLEIDRINILQAALLSMAMAVDNLHPRPDCLLIDGPFAIISPLFQRPIPKGDSLSASIAAASVVAKVSRDRLMRRYHEDYPEFGFDRHKGYPTRVHQAAIRLHGCSPIHRRSFKGVSAHAQPEAGVGKERRGPGG
jgi:ribonuclease HII